MNSRTEDRVIRPDFEYLEPRLLLSGSGAVELFTAFPALFVENQGQWVDTSVLYAYQDTGVNISFSDSALGFQLYQEEAAEDPATGDPVDPYPDETPPEDVVMVSTEFSAVFDGANIVSPVGLNQAETVYNYFVGDQANWRSGVSGFETIAYVGLYNGIDLLTWGQQNGLKQEFHVAPGADYQQIVVSYAGIDGLSLDSEGALHVQTPLGELIDEAPYIYQDIDGTRVEVTGAFQLIDSDTYTFSITGAYDAGQELIIDPDFAWSTYLGGGSYDYGYGIATDAEGNALVTGMTRSSGWVSGGFDTSHNGSYDAFVAKISPDGSHLWSTYLGGSSNDGGRGIATDAAGNALVTGKSWVSSASDNGNWDAFVAKISADGSQLLWSTYLGGISSDYGYGIATDAAGDALVAGHTSSTGWVFKGSDTSHNGGQDAFVAKISADGSHLWSTYLGGNNDDYGCGIATDAAGNALVTGYTSSTGWVSGGFNTIHNGGRDAFVAKISASGSQLWSTYIGGDNSDDGYDIATDAAGNALVSGLTYSTDWVSGGFDITHNGGKDAFVAKISASGSHLWSTYLGGGSNDEGYGIATDAAGNALVTGMTWSSGWVSDGFDTTHNGILDAFVAKISPSGSHLWSTYLGGSSLDFGWGIATDAAGNTLVTGDTSSANWVSDGFDTSHNGGFWDAYLVKINADNQPPTAQDDAYTVNEDTVLTVPAPGVLGNDSDADGDSLTAALVDGPSHGTLDLQADGSFIYTPEADFNGTDSFTYKANDGQLDSDVATVTITVNNLVDLSGRVFEDRDNDGVFNSVDGDAGIAGVTVDLLNQVTGETISTRTTGADGAYDFDDANLVAGTYKIVQTQPEGYLDGKETSGSIGGTVDNTGDWNEINDIVVGEPGMTDDGVGYDFAELLPASLQGLVWEDFNDDGEVDFGEKALANAAVRLTGIDDRGGAVDVLQTVDAQGIYEFVDLRPGTYEITETQPDGYIDGKDVLGEVVEAAPGVVVGEDGQVGPANDQFMDIDLVVGASGVNYNFGERIDGGEVNTAQVAMVGFWQNKHGQNLIKSLNGGSDSTLLGNWFAETFPNMFGGLDGTTNEGVADVFKQLFKQNGKTSPGGPPKLDAQVMAVALSTYVTKDSLVSVNYQTSEPDPSLTAEVESYGFEVTAGGLGSSFFNIGDSGEAFDGYNDWEDVQIIDLLLATDRMSLNELLYDDADGDGDGDGEIDEFEALLRTLANEVYSAINDQGEI